MLQYYLEYTTYLSNLRQCGEKKEDNPELCTATSEKMINQLAVLSNQEIEDIEGGIEDIDEFIDILSEVGVYKVSIDINTTKSFSDTEKSILINHYDIPG